MIPDGAAAVEQAALATMAATVTATHRMSERGARFLRQACGAGTAADRNPLQHRQPRVPALGLRARRHPGH